MIKQSKDINKIDNDQEQYETGNSGERDYSSPKKGGRLGSKLGKAMDRKSPPQPYRGKEYR